VNNLTNTNTASAAASAGFFYRQVTGPARRAKFPDPCSQHSLYLEYGRDNGLLTLPDDLSQP
jgi:hypothetical protein